MLRKIFNLLSCFKAELSQTFKIQIDFHFLLWMLLLMFKSEIFISFLIFLTLQLSDGKMIWYTLYILNYLPQVITALRGIDSCLLITLLSKYPSPSAKIHFLHWIFSAFGKEILSFSQRVKGHEISSCLIWTKN